MRLKACWIQRSMSSACSDTPIFYTTIVLCKTTAKLPTTVYHLLLCNKTCFLLVISPSQKEHLSRYRRRKTVKTSRTGSSYAHTTFRLAHYRSNVRSKGGQPFTQKNVHPNHLPFFLLPSSFEFNIIATERCPPSWTRSTPR